MNGIIINDKQYIFTTESSSCKDCVFIIKIFVVLPAMDYKNWLTDTTVM